MFKRVNIDCGNKWNKVADLVKVDEFQKTLASVQLGDLLESAQRIQMDYVHYLNKLVQLVEHSIKLRQLNWKKIHKLDELVNSLQWQDSLKTLHVKKIHKRRVVR